jgi:hypothetical protein
MPIFFVALFLPVLWHLCFPCLYTCSLAFCSTAIFLTARIFVVGPDLSILQMCPSCSSRLSVVFVTDHNICCQTTQHCNVNRHCCECIKSCALGSFACHVPPCIACGMSETVRCCVVSLPTTARSMFQRHCIFMDCHLDMF